MSLLVRSKGGGWERAKEVGYSDESHLQRLLYDSPDLIPVRGGEAQPRVFIREAGLPGSGSTDLLGVGLDGNIYLVECKLATNREVRRQVIGQIIEYGAFLWGMTYEEFDNLFVAREGKSLIELLQEKASAEWHPEDFRSTVTENLHSGEFTLLIAVDSINSELEQIIRYLRHRGPTMQVRAIELRLHETEKLEILSPQLHGEYFVSEKSAPAGKLSLEQVFARCESDLIRGRLRLLVDEWRGLGNLVEPGTSGLSFRATIGDQTRYVFWALNPNILSAVYSRLRSQGIPAGILDEYKKQLATISGFDATKVVTQSAPRASLEDMTEEDIRRLARIHQDLVGQWRDSLDET